MFILLVIHIYCYETSVFVALCIAIHVIYLDPCTTGNLENIHGVPKGSKKPAACTPLIWQVDQSSISQPSSSRRPDVDQLMLIVGMVFSARCDLLMFLFVMIRFISQKMFRKEV